ncbi:MAG: hypothetical protein GW873_09790 [Nitrospirae bacterium]|nr:hypothetical protein [Nitrospirota bacterium]PIV67167.1 MAG: hypothetical protein COS10_02430 [Nitrospirae bacterium CG01_land_8_20_14_3_00_44_22]PIW89012.1 MAG: hypothetical protein COZ93_07325 [Nitrospirae bacterium CG_4_8_14_3_um_filter_44_28]
MKLNIFKISMDKVADLKVKFELLGLKNINSSEQNGWKADFYFSKDIDPIQIPWASTYKEFFAEDKPENKIFFCAYIWENEKYCFALSYGKSHFYLRQFCDHDFGIHIAKRIANQKDIRQKSSKKFAGRKKKEIKSYTKNSQLDIESGESIDYVQSSISKDSILIFGKSGKFGSSALLNPLIGKEALPEFLESLIKVYDSPELFKLPRTVILDNSPITEGYENKLVEEIIASKDSTDFTSSSHELIGIDFIFSGQEKYKFSLNNYVSEEFEDLSIDKLNSFISTHSIPKEQILNIRVHIAKEDAKPFSKTVKESIDYIIDDQNILLTQGKWMKFNEDYMDQLNDYIDSVDMEEVESDLLEITSTEGNFNKNLKEHGYTDADKNFSIIKVKTGTLIEAWDSKKDETVYAVKFGTAQKLGYVCDQANNTLELISKKANIKKIDANFKNYCIWLVIQNKNLPKKISEINSIILKQKIESWARKCFELGIAPKIKMSRLVKENKQTKIPSP